MPIVRFWVNQAWKWSKNSYWNLSEWIKIHSEAGKAYRVRLVLLGFNCGTTVFRKFIMRLLTTTSNVYEVHGCFLKPGAISEVIITEGLLLEWKSLAIREWFTCLNAWRPVPKAEYCKWSLQGLVRECQKWPGNCSLYWAFCSGYKFIFMLFYSRKRI